MATRNLEARFAASKQDRIPRPFTWMLQLWAVWLVVYFGGGLLAMSKGETGFFAATVDAVDPLWIKLSVLNIPLHLICMTTALVLLQAGGARTLRVARGFAWAATLLVISHAALSIGLALAELGARLP